MLDPDALAAQLPESVEVWATTRTDHGWRLTELLPTGLDVYGGAVRVWWPITDPQQIDAREHPLFSIFSPSDAERVQRDLVKHILVRLAPPPQPGETFTARVTSVLAYGARFEFGHGFVGFAANSHLANGPIYNAWEAVRIGQQVKVQVTAPPEPGRDGYLLSLRPFAPDPWQRLTEVYEPGMFVEGVVVGLERYGAFVELLPGAYGLLPLKHVAQNSGDLINIDDHLAVDDRVIVQLQSLHPGKRRAELSLFDVPEDAQAQPPASLFAGGPGWLSDLADLNELGDGEPVDGAQTELEQQLAALEELLRERTLTEAIGATNGDARSTATLNGDQNAPALSPQRSVAELDRGELDQTVATARAAQGEIRRQILSAEQALAQVRNEAHLVTAELRKAVADAQLRIVARTRGEAAAIIAKAHEEIDQLREEINLLRDRASSDQRERRQLIAWASVQQKIRERETHRRHDAETRPREERQRAERLQAQLDVIDDRNPEQRFKRELHFTWSTLYATEEDRRRYPFTEPLIGPAFLDSVSALDGISPQKILEVCTHVIAGRAHEINSLELHQLRTSDGSESPVRIRDDGAKAWRVSLQVNSSAARRLHYWQLMDGRIELSKAGVHDDHTIV